MPNLQPKTSKIVTRIINLSRQHLTDSQVGLQLKGLKFTPTPNRNEQLLQTELKTFLRKLRLAEWHTSLEEDVDGHEITNDQISIIENKSKANPQKSKNPVLDNFLEKIEIKSNIKREEKSGLEQLKNNDEIVIQEAYKEGAIVLMDRDYYRSKILSILNNNEYYKESKEVHQLAVKRKIKKRIQDYKYLTNDEQDYLVNYESKPPFFFMDYLKYIKVKKFKNK
ncbi:hypothetical protein SNE40_014359 [Patella caerulea]|uniref:Uncharacterized protein n=1 Tax=Patella caerulea TaxID=87958 RepID=A0AAN8JKZ6_PATCE